MLLGSRLFFFFKYGVINGAVQRKNIGHANKNDHILKKKVAICKHDIALVLVII